MNEERGPRSHQEQTMEEMIQAAARVLLKAATDVIQADPHQWSSRPCASCAAVSSIIGRRFGCLTKQDTRIRSKPE